MCWCFPFNLSSSSKRKTTSSSEKKKRVRPGHESLRGTEATVAQDHEKRRRRDIPEKRRSREALPPRSSRKEREREYNPRSGYSYYDTGRSRDQYRPSLNVYVPNMWYRSVDSEDSDSSQEKLLNPRPHRSPRHRQRHPKRNSQSTLRGRGAKRDPPRGSKSKKNLRNESSRQSWFFAPSPPKTPSRQHRNYQALEHSPRSQRSARTHHSSPRDQGGATHEASPSQRHHRSRQQQRNPQGLHHGRSQTPNTAAHRVPDRRFAVLAATNNALEDLRREAFAQPSPPPRRERLQRYQGVTIPTSSIPFNWDCVSSSQTSAGHAESSTRHRRSRR